MLTTQWDLFFPLAQSEYRTKMHKRNVLSFLVLLLYLVVFIDPAIEIVTGCDAKYRLSGMGWRTLKQSNFWAILGLLWNKLMVSRHFGMKSNKLSMTSVLWIIDAYEIAWSVRNIQSTTCRHFLPALGLSCGWIMKVAHSLDGLASLKIFYGL